MIKDKDFIYLTDKQKESINVYMAEREKQRFERIILSPLIIFLGFLTILKVIYLVILEVLSMIFLFEDEPKIINSVMFEEYNAIEKGGMR